MLWGLPGRTTSPMAGSRLTSNVGAATGGTSVLGLSRGQWIPTDASFVRSSSAATRATLEMMGATLVGP